MNEDIENMKREIEEVRRLKRELEKEIEEVRLAQADIRQRRDHSETRRRNRPPKPPRTPRSASMHFDFAGLTDSLEDMMEGLGEQISIALEGIEGVETKIHIPQFKVRRRGRNTRSEVAAIPPERVAEIISPLGSEERLRILDFLKDGGKSFNEIESHVGKTGSSLTHHLNPLLDAGYVIKGEVRGTYYVTVVGRLAYRLAQWLTSRVELEKTTNGQPKTASGNNRVDIEFEEAEESETEEDEASADNEYDDSGDDW